MQGSRPGRNRSHVSGPRGLDLDSHSDDFALTWLPGYAPELNPEEQCNQWVKQDMLHALPDSIDDLHHVVRGRFRRLPHHPAVLAHFFSHAGLHVN